MIDPIEYFEDEYAVKRALYVENDNHIDCWDENDLYEWLESILFFENKEEAEKYFDEHLIISGDDSILRIV